MPLCVAASLPAPAQREQGQPDAQGRWDFPFGRQHSFRLPQAVCEAPSELSVKQSSQTTELNQSNSSKPSTGETPFLSHLRWRPHSELCGLPAAHRCLPGKPVQCPTTQFAQKATGLLPRQLVESTQHAINWCKMRQERMGEAEGLSFGSSKSSSQFVCIIEPHFMGGTHLL